MALSTLFLGGKFHHLANMFFKKINSNNPFFQKTLPKIERIKKFAMFLHNVPASSQYIKGFE
jgi:hypothetical protein